MKNLANIITISRIGLSVWMIFAKPLSPCFYALYTLCGLTDILDGAVARLTNTQSKTGALLDSTADFLFCAVGAIKLFPCILPMLTGWIYAAVILVIAIRAVSLIAGGLKYRRFAMRHTYLNKLTGFAVFILPYFLSVQPLYKAAAILAAVSAAEELIMNITLDKFEADKKSIVTLRSVD